MRITRLELHGFKSFADRTVFQFGPGISCVVGPNGCGKSNVVDALRWCMGEQSAKSLRGGEMADVIFAGSADRKPVGYAEVSITMATDETHPFPGEYARFHEVQVGRRLYRSGASEYLINQARVRRKDIVDLFMDSGAGNDLYAFIEQGRIDKVVSASSEDRRSLLDEAAGITRYLRRREEALRKLEATSAQLDRAADVTDEMERRLRTLQRQVLQAARFRRARALLRQDEVALGLVKLAGLDGDREEAEQRASTWREELVGREADAEAAREDAEARRREVEVAEQSAERAQEAFAEVDGARREVAARRELHAARAEELTERVAQAQREVQAAEASAERARGESDQAARTLAEAQAERDEADRQAQTAQAALAEAQAVEEVARRHRDEAAAHAQEARDERVQASAELEAARRQAASLPEQQARVAERRERAEAERIAVVKRAQVAVEAVAKAIASRDAALARREQAEEAMEGVLRRDHHARDTVLRAERALDEAQEAYQQAVAEAEHTAGEADEVVAARLDRVRAQEEAALRKAAHEDAARIDAEEASRREALMAEERTARAALDEAEAQAAEATASWRAAEEAAREAEQTRLAREEDEATRRVAEAVAEAEEAARASAEATREEAQARVEAAEARVADRRQAMEDAEASRALAARKLAEVEGRLSALEAEDEASRRRDAGARAVAEALPEAPRLLDWLDDVDPDAARWLGSDVLLPVVDDGELATAGQAAEAAGSARVVLRPEERSVQGVLARVERVADLTSAVAHFRRTGGAAVVASTGDRIDVDGVVRLGRGEEAGEALGRRDAIASARAQAASLQAEVARHQQAATDARAGQEAARIAARTAATRRDEVEAQGRRAIAEASKQARQAADDAIEAARAARAAHRASSRASLDAALSKRVEEEQAASLARRTDVEARLDGLRDEMTRALGSLRQEIAAAQASRRAEAEARIEAARDRIRDEVRATTRDVVVKRERLAQDVASARETLAQARRRAEEAGEALAQARRLVEDAERERAEHARVLARLEAERVAAEEQQASLARRAEEAASELESLASIAAQTGQRVAEAQARQEEASARSEARALLHQQALEAWQAAEASRGRCQAEVDRIAMALAGLRERIAASAARQEAGIREVGEAARRREEAQTRLADAAIARDEAIARAAEAEAEESRLATRCQEAGTAREEARARLRALREARDRAESSLAHLEDGLGDLRQRTLDAEQTVQQLSMQRTQLVERITERHDVDLPALLGVLLERGALRLEPSAEAAAGITLGDKVVEPVGARIVRLEDAEREEVVRSWVASAEALRQELAKIGEVHLGALEEYEEVAGRHAELVAQRTDLEEGVATIREAIAQLNDTCRERFRDAFDRVDAAFRKSYPELVGGGEARLELTDEEDLLTTGVEIFVRPPGKRMQNLTLLSGGEKAMTAIALLLALFSVKPSPFCVLDEVDAPLDEANGARFNDMIRRMSAATQFIVITHNRKTMECADALYGITMKKTAGCSSLVSVEVD